MTHLSLKSVLVTIHVNVQLLCFLLLLTSCIHDNLIRVKKLFELSCICWDMFYGFVLVALSTFCSFSLLPLGVCCFTELSMFVCFLFLTYSYILLKCFLSWSLIFVTFCLPYLHMGFKYILQWWLSDHTCLSLCLSWKVFNSPLNLRDNFVGYHNLGRQLFAFRTWSISFCIFLDFRISVDFRVSDIILKCLPLYASWHFLLKLFMVFICIVDLAFWLECDIMKPFLVMSIWHSMCLV
jgi:hypothetical protein